MTDVLGILRKDYDSTRRGQGVVEKRRRQGKDFAEADLRRSAENGLCHRGHAQGPQGQKSGKSKTNGAAVAVAPFAPRLPAGNARTPFRRGLQHDGQRHEKLSVEEIIFIYVLAWIERGCSYARHAGTIFASATGKHRRQYLQNCTLVQRILQNLHPRIRAIATSCPYISYAIISPGWPRRSSHLYLCGKRSASGSRMSSGYAAVVMATVFAAVRIVFHPHPLSGWPSTVCVRLGRKVV